MKLYRVTCEIEYEVLCLAESEDAAIEACRDGYVEEEMEARSFWELIDVHQPGR